MPFDVSTLSNTQPPTGLWGASRLHALARDEAAGRRRPRLTEPKLDTWARFRGRLFVLERGEDGLLRVNAIVARRAAHADVGGGREEHEALWAGRLDVGETHPDGARGDARAVHFHGGEEAERAGLVEQALGEEPVLGLLGKAWLEQRRGAVNAQHALGAAERALPEQLGEGVVVIEGLDDLELPDAALGARALLHAGEELEQLALGDRRGRERAPTAHAVDEPPLPLELVPKRAPGAAAAPKNDVQWVAPPAALRTVSEALCAADVVGLDVETALDSGTLCLVQIATRKRTFLERRVLAALSTALDGVFDTLEASRRAHGPDVLGGHSLAMGCERELGISLDKSEQTSNWSRRPLDADQLNYAALDAGLLLALHEPFKDMVSAPDEGEWR